MNWRCERGLDRQVLKMQIVGSVRSAENVRPFLLRHNALSWMNPTFMMSPSWWDSRKSSCRSSGQNPFYEIDLEGFFY